MNCISPQPTVVIIAGETSGDLHGARVVNAMQARDDRIAFHGVGGAALEKEGVHISVDAARLSVVGLTEVVSKLPAILDGMKTVKGLIRRLKPNLLILIDFPDFNLKIAAFAKKLQIPILYYISPQLWAWRPRRVKQIAKLVDHMAVILPFEEDFYKKHKVPATFVGHPLLDDDLPERSAACEADNADRPVIGLLPGSRESEIVRHVPVMLGAAQILLSKHKRVQFLISHAPAVERNQLETLVEDHAGDVEIEITSDPVPELFKRCNLVVAASGTVTLQAALYGMPMVIIYRVSPLSFWFGRALVRVKNIGLVNLIAGHEIVPELVQYQASAVNIAAKINEIVNDSASRRRMRQDMFKVRDLLGGPGASQRVADIALQMIYAKGSRFRV
jgi:lipid-A-disaccharide synthase